MKGRPGFLELADGAAYEGMLFGAEEPSDGEVVFNTGMVGYVESLTDPSYRGQILTFTYPLIGNYGVPSPESDRFESKGVQVRGLVVSSQIDDADHWEASRSLNDWLSEQGITGISGIDTRSLTRRLRSEGTMLGRIVQGEPDSDFNVADPNASHLVGEVTSREPVTFEPEDGDGTRVLVVDTGCKRSIVRSLLKRGATVTTVPCDHTLTGMDFDGVLISNGPGDPMRCRETIANVASLLARGNVPVSGICLGTQIMALAAGATTYKLPYGHRSQNQPCHEVGTDHYVITSQNHGYAIDADSLPDGWEVWYTNLNDGTVEGIRHTDRPFSAVQFHPEANPGPTDSSSFFDRFLEVVRDG